MTASFAAYASQFLNRQKNGGSSLTSSQPMFFSFTTQDDGSRAGNEHDGDLDDVDDPHLRASGATTSRGEQSRRYERDDDPYLRLDEDELGPAPGSRYDAHSIPLLQSNTLSDTEPSRGWLAHQASPLRSPSPPTSSSESEPDSPPADLVNPGLGKSHRAPHPNSVPPPPPVSLSLTQSLLPRDGRTRPLDVFSLPDPRHVARGRRKYNDSIWTAVYCASLSVCIFFSVLILFLTNKPTKYPSKFPFPYTTLLHTVPLLTILTFVSAVVAYAHILLLRVFVKPVVFATSVFVPATLFISAICAFVGSFMWDGDTTPTWGETWGLRLFSLVPLVLSLLTARRLVNLPRDIHTTSALLTMATDLLYINPFLLALSPAVLLSALLISIPFLTLIFRLLLVGHLTSRGGQGEWQIEGWADWAICAVVAVWLWTWGLARGLLRVTTSGVIAAWYFSDPDLPPPPPTSTHTIHAALFRATHSSLGSIILSSLILTSLRLLAFASLFLRTVPAYLFTVLPIPLPFRPYATTAVWGAGMAAGWLEGVGGSLSGYALVYVGVTGDGFWIGARRGRELVRSVESRGANANARGVGAGGGRYGRKFKTEPPLTLLTIAPLTLTFPFALSTYLFVAHTLSAPQQALGASVLAGGVTALVGLFCVGLVRDVADTLWVCYCIDRESGGVGGRGERGRVVLEMFEYDARRTGTSRSAPPHQHQHQHPRARAQPPPSSQAPSAHTPSRRQQHQQQQRHQPPVPKPNQPISQRVNEHMTSPESSPELGDSVELPLPLGEQEGAGEGGAVVFDEREEEEERRERQREKVGRVSGGGVGTGAGRREDEADVADVDPFMRDMDDDESEDDRQHHSHSNSRHPHLHLHQHRDEEGRGYGEYDDSDEEDEEERLRMDLAGGGHAPHPHQPQTRAQYQYGQGSRSAVLGMGASQSGTSSMRRARDEEEGLGLGASAATGMGSGLGAGGLSGLFPGSDLF